MDESTLLKIVLSTGILSVIAGVIGCFVIWRRMAYFSDSLSHSALLGVALGLALGIDISIMMMLVCFVFGLGLTWLLHKEIFTSDTLLGIFAHSSLGIGVFVLGLIGEETDIHHYLFGDVMSVKWLHIPFIFVGASVALGIVMVYWSRLLLTTLSAELAVAEGVSLRAMQFLLVSLTTIIVATSIQIVGVLLLTSLLLIPAATARTMARSPKTMALFSGIMGAFCSIIGSVLAIRFGMPPGPTIVVTLTVVFILIYGVSLFRVMLYGSTS